ncbi:MAG: prepilin-type N-terminal cleavage/methylation domain-containing protein [Candidatus Xenobiia bacterium LiM19]
MKRRSSGFTFMELMIVILILSILLSIASFALKNYESRYRCQAAAQVLAMDIRLQQQRARSRDEQQGIFFYSSTRYALGRHPTSLSPNETLFVPNNPPRIVNLTDQYNGVVVDSVGGSLSFPQYIYFDPSTVDSAGNWIPLSGFTGDIVFKGSRSFVTLTVQANMEITITIR